MITRITLIVFLLIAVATHLAPTYQVPAGPPAEASAEDLPRPAAYGEFMVTAYCHCEKCCGKWAQYRGGGWTASGAHVQEGVTIAVDPVVIPLGSRVWIEGLGWRLAQDTGSSVRGRHIDVYLPTHAEAIRFGRRKLMVIVAGRDSQ